MARRNLYKPGRLPPPGIVRPLGKLTRLEANDDTAHSEAHWEYAPGRGPDLYWSDEQNAAYVYLGTLPVISKGMGTPDGTEAIAREFENWQLNGASKWTAGKWAKQSKWEFVDTGSDPSLEVVGSMISITYHSNKGDGKWKKHVHRPALNSRHQGKDIVSTGGRWIFIKGPRMRATWRGIKY